MASGAMAAVLSDLQQFARALENGAFEDGVAIMTALITQDPRRAKFFAYRAKALLLMGRLDDALSDAAQALKRDPNLALANLCKGCALVGLGTATGNTAMLRSGAAAMQTARKEDPRVEHQAVFKAFEATLQDHMARGNQQARTSVAQNDFGVRIPAAATTAGASTLMSQSTASSTISTVTMAAQAVLEKRGEDGKEPQAMLKIKNRGSAKMFAQGSLEKDEKEQREAEFAWKAAMQMVRPKALEEEMLWLTSDVLLASAALTRGSMRSVDGAREFEVTALIRDRRSLEDGKRMVAMLMGSVKEPALKANASLGFSKLQFFVHKATATRMLQACLRSFLAVLREDALVESYEDYVANAQQTVFTLLSQGDTALSLKQGSCTKLALRIIASCLASSVPKEAVILLGLRLQLQHRYRHYVSSSPSVSLLPDFSSATPHRSFAKNNEKTAQPSPANVEGDSPKWDSLLQEIDMSLEPYIDLEAMRACDEVIDFHEHWTGAPPWLGGVDFTSDKERIHFENLTKQAQATLAASMSEDQDYNPSADATASDDLEAAFAYTKVIDVETGYGPWSLVPWHRATSAQSELPPEPRHDVSRGSTSLSDLTSESKKSDEDFSESELANAKLVERLAEAWSQLTNSNERDRLRSFSMEDLQQASQALRGEIPGRPLDCEELLREMLPDSSSVLRTTAPYNIFTLAYETPSTAKQETLERLIGELREVFSRVNFGKLNASTLSAQQLGRPLRLPSPSGTHPTPLLETDAGKTWKRVLNEFAEAENRLRVASKAITSSAAKTTVAPASSSSLQNQSTLSNLEQLSTLPSLDERLIPCSAFPPGLCVLVDLAKGYPLYGYEPYCGGEMLEEEAYFVMRPRHDSSSSSNPSSASSAEIPSSLAFAEGWLVSKRCASACFSERNLIPVYLGAVPIRCECGLYGVEGCSLDLAPAGHSTSSWLPELKLKSSSTSVPNSAMAPSSSAISNASSKRQVVMYVDNFLDTVSRRVKNASKRKKRVTVDNETSSTNTSHISLDLEGTKDFNSSNRHVHSAVYRPAGCAEASPHCGGCHFSSGTERETAYQPLAAKVASNHNQETNDLAFFKRLLHLAQIGPALANELQHELHRGRDLLQGYAAKRDEVFAQGERLFNLMNMVTYLQALEKMHQETQNLALRHIDGPKSSLQSSSRGAKENIEHSQAASMIFTRFIDCVSKLCQSMNAVERVSNSLLEVTMDSPMQTMRFQASLKRCQAHGRVSEASTNTSNSNLASHTDDINGGSKASETFLPSAVEVSKGEPTKQLAGGASVLNALVSRAASAGKSAREDMVVEESSLRSALAAQQALELFSHEFLAPVSRLAEEICVAAAVNPYENFESDATKSITCEKQHINTRDLFTDNTPGDVRDASDAKKADANESLAETWDSWREDINDCLQGVVETHELRTMMWKQEQFTMGKPASELHHQEARRILKTAAELYPSPTIAHELPSSHREKIITLLQSAADTLAVASQVSQIRAGSASPETGWNARSADEQVLSSVRTLYKDQLSLLGKTAILDRDIGHYVQKNFSSEEDLEHIGELVAATQQRLSAARSDFADSSRALGNLERSLRCNLTMRCQFFTATIAQLLISRLETVARETAAHAKQYESLLKEVERGSSESAKASQVSNTSTSAASSTTNKQNTLGGAQKSRKSKSKKNKKKSACSSQTLREKATSPSPEDDNLQDSAPVSAPDTNVDLNVFSNTQSTRSGTSVNEVQSMRKAESMSSLVLDSVPEEQNIKVESMESPMDSKEEFSLHVKPDLPEADVYVSEDWTTVVKSRSKKVQQKEQQEHYRQQQSSQHKKSNKTMHGGTADSGVSSPSSILVPSPTHTNEQKKRKNKKGKPVNTTTNSKNNKLGNISNTTPAASAASAATVTPATTSTTTTADGVVARDDKSATNRYDKPSQSQMRSSTQETTVPLPSSESNDKLRDVSTSKTSRNQGEEITMNELGNVVSSIAINNKSLTSPINGYDEASEPATSSLTDSKQSKQKHPTSVASNEFNNGTRSKVENSVVGGVPTTALNSAEVSSLHQSNISTEKIDHEKSDSTSKTKKTKKSRKKRLPTSSAEANVPVIDPMDQADVGDEAVAIDNVASVLTPAPADVASLCDDENDKCGKENVETISRNPEDSDHVLAVSARSSSALPSVSNICRPFLQGHCKEGGKCLLRHVTPLELHDEMVAWESSSKTADQKPGTDKNGRYHSENLDKMQELPPEFHPATNISPQVPTAPPSVTYGIPYNQMPMPQMFPGMPVPPQFPGGWQNAQPYYYHSGMLHPPTAPHHMMQMHSSPYPSRFAENNSSEAPSTLNESHLAENGAEDVPSVGLVPENSADEEDDGQSGHLSDYDEGATPHTVESSASGDNNDNVDDPKDGDNKFREKEELSANFQGFGYGPGPEAFPHAHGQPAPLHPMYFPLTYPMPGPYFPQGMQPPHLPLHPHSHMMMHMGLPHPGMAMQHIPPPPAAAAALLPPPPMHLMQQQMPQQMQQPIKQHVQDEAGSSSTNDQSDV